MHDPSHPERGRPEPDRTRVGVVVAAAAGIVVVTLALGWMSVRMARSYSSGSQGSPPVPLTAPPYEERMSAHWQSPQGDLEHVQNEARQRLENYRWLDRPSGVVQIPIGRAMELVAAAAPTPQENQPGASP